MPSTWSSVADGIGAATSAGGTRPGSRNDRGSRGRPAGRDFSCPSAGTLVAAYREDLMAADSRGCPFVFILLDRCAWWPIHPGSPDRGSPEKGGGLMTRSRCAAVLTILAVPTALMLPDAVTPAGR